jgi:hypothetical protein
MEPEGKQTSDKDAPSLPLFEDPQFHAHRIPVALELMFGAIQRCRYMMHEMPAQSLFSDALERRGSAKLSSRDRKALDSTLALYWRDMEEQSRPELEKYGVAEAAAGDEMYPLSEEAARTIQSLMLRNVAERVGLEHFNKYRNDPVKVEYILANLRLGPKADRESTIGAILVPFLVSKMEDFLAELVRVALSIHPEALGGLPAIPDSIYKKYKSHLSSVDIERWQIDKRVSELIKSSPDEWRATIKKRMKIDIGDAGGDWERINEVIQRRHAITHNNGTVDQEYLSRIGDDLRHGLALGDSLLCNASYVTATLVEVETWCACLALQWAKHYFGEKARYHPLIISKVVELESSGNWVDALAILDAYLSTPPPSSSSDVSLGKINRWLCRQELGQEHSRLKAEILAWSPQGDDAEDKLRFEAGRAALLRDHTELAILIRRGRGSGMESFYTLSNYPLFKRAIRESQQVARLIQGASAQRRTPVRRKRQGRKR